MPSAVMNPFFLRVITSLIVALAARFLYQGYTHRSRVRSLKKQGIPILPHSLLFGHLPIFADFRKETPPDVNIYVFHTWLAENYEKYFPGSGSLPPVIYLDLWPLTSSLAMVTDPAAASQFTVTQSLPKVGIVKEFISTLTSCVDILTTEGQAWKTWRSRFNPGFSQRNLTTMLPEIIEEVAVFVDGLKKLAGDSGSWGPVFQLEEKTTNLTFDIICRATLDMRLHEQSRESDSPLKGALIDQLRLMGIMRNVARGILFGRMPWHDASVARNNNTMRDILLPQIQKKIQSGQYNTHKKTVIDLAIKHFEEDGQNIPTMKLDTAAVFIDRLIANLKMFLFAGHDTTAAAICFMFKLLQDNPKSLTKLQEEHDTVLGSDPDKVAEILTKSPYLLNSLPYTLGVIKETLRLYAIAATIREAPPGFCLTASADASITYPMDGFGLWVSAPCIQRHPSYWPRPDEFLPERWMAPNGDPLYPSSSAWVPFSLGPRNCIGMELAMMELKLVLVMTVRAFDIEEAWLEWDKKQGSRATPSHMVKGQRLYQVGTSIAHPKDGMPVHVRMREFGTVA
ncbi:cytochrome P450 4V3 [Hypomontagnella monticulosa]|nr:cytochrome P450 4V3 [Hypomontagnella monticulosa]